MDKRERLITAYTYLKNKGVVHTQRNVAERLRTNEANISKALKGVEGVLTDGFLKRFNRAYGDIFNMDWLLYGEGEMLRCPAATVQQHNIHGDNNAAHTITSGDTATDKLLNIVTQSQHLATTSPARNARNVHLRNLRAVFNDAIDNGLTTCYPFRRFRITPQETAHRALTVAQLRTLFSYPCEAWQQEYVDMFKLIFFLCGINVGDLFHLTAITNGRVEYRRAKTHKLYSIKVEEEAQEIIDRYRGTAALLSPADRYKSHADYAKHLNRAVQHVGTYTRQGRGGRKVFAPLFPTITTYWMRHTWATIAADLDIPVDTISRALGHSQTTGARVTSVYIAFDRAKVDAANRRVLDWVLYGKK